MNIAAGMGALDYCKPQVSAQKACLNTAKGILGNCTDACSATRAGCYRANADRPYAQNQCSQRYDSCAQTCQGRVQNHCAATYQKLTACLVVEIPRWPAHLVDERMLECRKRWGAKVTLHECLAKERQDIKDTADLSHVEYWARPTFRATGRGTVLQVGDGLEWQKGLGEAPGTLASDRKSTRLNSSHT